MKPNPHIIDLLEELCREALVEEDESGSQVPPFFLMREGVTITLTQKGATLLQSIITELRKEEDIRIKLSKKEVQHEVVTSMFQGTEALENGNFDAGDLAGKLIGRLREGRDTWNIYLPISGLKLPEGQALALSGGTFKSLTNEEKLNLKAEYVETLEQTHWQSSEQRESGISNLSQEFDEIMDSSESWFHIAIEGRPQAAKQTATEAAALGMDILLFWSLYLDIDPEISALSLPLQSITNRMSTFQFVPAKEYLTNLEAPARVPYMLDASRFAKLTTLSEFEQIRLISNKPEPNQVEEKFLLAIQQFAEATRLPSATLKLVWYLSTLETVLVKDSEGSRHKKVERRIGKLLSERAAELVGPLYDKRRKPVHYGNRNRVGAELVTEVDLQRARSLAFLGIVHSISRVTSATNHDAFLDEIDAH